MPRRPPLRYCWKPSAPPIFRAIEVLSLWHRHSCLCSWVCLFTGRPFLTCRGAAPLRPMSARSPRLGYFGVRRLAAAFATATTPTISNTSPPSPHNPRRVPHPPCLRLALGFPSLRYPSHELEGAPSFAPFAKGGLLPSNATHLLLFALGFPSLSLSSYELEGAPSFAHFAKGGLLPSNATHLPLFALGFPSLRYPSHELEGAPILRAFCEGRALTLQRQNLSSPPLLCELCAVCDLCVNLFPTAFRPPPSPHVFSSPPPPAPRSPPATPSPANTALPANALLSPAKSPPKTLA